MTVRSGEADAPNLSLKTRLKAWWEGYDLSGLRHRKGDSAEAGEPAVARASAPVPSPGMDRWGKPLWSATRVEVVEKLWGPGFTSPGGSDHVPHLVRPLGLNPAMTVLDLSAGLGGTSRTMAGKFGCWVTGLEASPLLAKEGMERSIKAGLSKQAPVEPYDPEHFSYGRRVDAVFYKEGLFAVRHKDQLFDGLEMQLKPRGHVLITDYIVDAAEIPDSLVSWADHESQEPHLWTKDQMTNAFAQRNLDLRISEDISDTHRGLILTAIQRFLEYLEKHHMDQVTKVNVVDEIELWVRRVAALEAGLRCYRFHAIKPPE